MLHKITTIMLTFKYIVAQILSCCVLSIHKNIARTYLAFNIVNTSCLTIVDQVSKINLVYIKQN